MRKTALERAMLLIGALSLDELRQVRDEAARLIGEYQQGGVLSGWGSWEVKYIKKKQLNKTTGEIEDVSYGPYLYLKRWMIDDKGKRRLKQIGYYGTAGAALSDAEKDELLRIHNEQGEAAADAYVEERTQHLDINIPERRDETKFPAQAPKHPLSKPLSGTQLNQDTVFTHFRDATPVEAAQLLAAVEEWERLSAAYQAGRQSKFQKKLPLDAVQLDMWRKGVRRKPQPLRYVKTSRGRNKMNRPYRPRNK